MKYIISENQLKFLIREEEISNPDRLKHFSNIVWRIVKEYHKTKSNIDIQTAIYWSLYRVITEWSKVPPSYISKNVADAFIYKKPNKDPFELTRSSRNIFGKKKGKPSFLLFEHTTPVSYFCDRLIESNSLDEVFTKLKYYTGIAIVTRAENDCLDRNFKSERPGRWRNSYQSCKIHPLSPKEYKEYKERKIGNFSEEEKEIISFLYDDFFKEYY